MRNYGYPEVERLIADLRASKREEMLRDAICQLPGPDRGQIDTYEAQIEYWVGCQATGYRASEWC